MKAITRSLETPTTKISTNSQHLIQNTKVVKIQTEENLITKEKDISAISGSSNSTINISETVLVHNHGNPSDKTSVDDHLNMIGHQKNQEEEGELFQNNDLQGKILEIKSSAIDIVSTDQQYRQEQQDDIDDHNDRRSSTITTDNDDEEYDKNDIDEESKSVKSANTATTDISNSNLSSIVATKKTTSRTQEKEENVNTNKDKIDSIITSPTNTTPVISTTPTKSIYDSSPYHETLEHSTSAINGICQEESIKAHVVKESPKHQEELTNSNITSEKNHQQADAINSPSKSRPGTEQSSNRSTTLSERGDSSTSLISQTSPSTMGGGGNRRRDETNKEARPSSRVSNMSYSSQIGMNEVCNLMIFLRICLRQFSTRNKLLMQNNYKEKQRKTFITSVFHLYIKYISNSRLYPWPSG